MSNGYDSWRTGIQIDNIYPVGSIYMSVDSTNPGDLFGGSWSPIEGRFLFAADSSHSAGSTGGASSVTITTSNMPAHTHSVGAHAHGLNSHTHSLSSHTHSLQSHTHGTGNSTYTHFLMNDGTNVGVNGTARNFPSTGGSAYFVYQSTTGEGHQINERNATSGPSTANTGAASGNTGAASGSTANSTAFNSGSTGSGTAINIMPPYLAVYMWQRTA